MNNPLSPPSAPVQGRLQSPPAKSKFLAVCVLVSTVVSSGVLVSAEDPINTSALGQVTNASTTITVDRKPRVIMMTDIVTSPEIDDMQSYARFMMYPDVMEVEGIIICGGWSATLGRIDLAREGLNAYKTDVTNLRKRNGQSSFMSLEQENGEQPFGYWPSYEYLYSRTVIGNSGTKSSGTNYVGPGKSTAGSNLIIQQAMLDDDRPIMVMAWGGPNTFYQALLDAKAQLSSQDYLKFISKVRCMAIKEQDNTSPLIGNNFPEAKYMINCGYCEYMMHNDSYNWDPIITNDWVDTYARNHGAIGTWYRKGRSEGDTPSVFSVIAPGGLQDFFEHPEWGGWAGRHKQVRSNLYVASYHNWWLTTGVDLPTLMDSFSAAGLKYENGMRRFVDAIQKDFEARFDWAKDGVGNKNPIACVNGNSDNKPLKIKLIPGSQLVLDASNSSVYKPNNQLSYEWWYYKEAGTYTGSISINGVANPIQTSPIKSSTATVNVPSDAGSSSIHIVLVVKDNDTVAPLYSYKRIVLDPSYAPATTPTPTNSPTPKVTKGVSPSN